MSIDPADRAALATAFADPLDRACADAGAGDGTLDRIALRDHIREIEVGAFQQERGVRQRVRFDVVVEVRPDLRAVAGDDVDGILSYDALTDAIDAALIARRPDLLERLAEDIAARILTHARAARTFVRIGKLDRGPHVLSVEIVRSRAAAATARAAPPPRPRIVVLGPGALEHPALPDLIDRLTAAAAPAIVLAMPAGPVPEAANPPAQRRIDLLALEQAAWQLAARDPRCVVIASRTELDWALRRGNLSVWAPSRMVLSAHDAPMGADAVALARWLARAFDACAVLLVGAGAASDGEVAAVDAGKALAALPPVRP